LFSSLLLKSSVRLSGVTANVYALSVDSRSNFGMTKTH